ncbi:putative Ran-binding protein [Leptomonas seymouri]|uniref:Putative Ran-binding protein n=1 Tax=Leptomonas seymouri TaxID=5684 RepID=A0A0N1PBA3_LEPSE|nr:putative Ran-binding protein [Leptomonas seymouri]|eukprot:KPI85641.1 putative Ran-binding protein [Leptomonas seymouri]
MPVATRTVELFGGAMRIRLPTSMVDVSDFRQVPDNQEVYADSTTGASFIIELLSRQRSVANEDAGAFFFHDLANDNGCSLDDIQGCVTTELPPSAYPRLSAVSSSSSGAQRCDFACLTTGMQCISKYTNEEAKKNDVFVGLVVLRFTPPVSTEVLVSLSCPACVHPESSEARVVERLVTEEDRHDILQQATASLEVLEWALFVPEE